jgi:hypothetical protein
MKVAAIYCILFLFFGGAPSLRESLLYELPFFFFYLGLPYGMSLIFIYIYLYCIFQQS